MGRRVSFKRGGYMGIAQQPTEPIGCLYDEEGTYYDDEEMYPIIYEEE